MPGCRPISSIAEFETLDESDLLLGYIAGFDGVSPDEGWSRSFLHGWRNGSLDSGRREADNADALLAAKFRSLA